MSRSYVLIGAGGHARVLVNALLQKNMEVSTIVAPNKPINDHSNKRWLKSDAEALKLDPEEVFLINGVGSTGDTRKRSEIYSFYKKNGFEFQTVVHNKSTLEISHSGLSEGVQVLAGAFVNINSDIGENCVLNSNVHIEHDVTVEKNCFIACSSTICGGCHIGEHVHIGPGVVVTHGITIGHGSVIAAGAVVVSNVPPYSLMMGVPARKQRSLK